MTGMTNHAKKGEVEEFCISVQSFSSSVCGLTEASVQVNIYMIMFLFVGSQRHPYRYIYI